MDAAIRKAFRVSKRWSNSSYDAAAGILPAEFSLPT